MNRPRAIDAAVHLRHMAAAAQRSTAPCAYLRLQCPMILPSAVSTLWSKDRIPSPCAKRRLNLVPKIPQAAGRKAWIHVYQCFSRTKTKPKQLTANTPTCQHCCQNRRGFAANRRHVQRRLLAGVPTPASASAAAQCTIRGWQHLRELFVRKRHG